MAAPVEGHGARRSRRAREPSAFQPKSSGPRVGRTDRQTNLMPQPHLRAPRRPGSYFETCQRRWKIRCEVREQVGVSGPSAGMGRRVSPIASGGVERRLLQLTELSPKDASPARQCTVSRSCGTSKRRNGGSARLLRAPTKRIRVSKSSTSMTQQEEGGSDTARTRTWAHSAPPWDQAVALTWFGEVPPRTAVSCLDSGDLFLWRSRRVDQRWTWRRAQRSRQYQRAMAPRFVCVGGRTGTPKIGAGGAGRSALDLCRSGQLHHGPSVQRIPRGWSGT